MFGIGHGPEIIGLLVVVLLVFGPGKLPEIGSAVGRGIREFRDATSGRDERPAPALSPTAEARGLQQPGRQWAAQGDVREPVIAEPGSPVLADRALAGR